MLCSAGPAPPAETDQRAGRGRGRPGGTAPAVTAATLDPGRPGSQAPVSAGPYRSSGPAALLGRHFHRP